MKKLLGIISLLTLILGCLIVPAVAMADSNPSPTSSGAPTVKSAVVTKADGSTVAASEYKEYTYADIVNGKVSDTTIVANMNKAKSDIDANEDLGKICSGLNDVAKAMNSSYDSSVFDVADLFEFNYELEAGETITVTFQIGSTEDSTCMHLVNGTTWEVAETSQSGNSLEVTFDALCPVAILTVSAAKAAAVASASANSHSDVAFYIIIAVLVVIIIVLLVKMILDSKKNKEAMEAQNAKIAECEENVKNAKEAQKAAEAQAQANAEKEAAKEEEAAPVAPAEKVVETAAVVGTPVEADAAGARYFSITYNRSFIAKLSKASDEAKEYYSELRNEIESYGSKAYTNWKFENYRVGRAFPIKLAVRGKTLCAYFALDPKELEGTKYNVENVSESATYAATPSLFRVSGVRKIKHAKELVAMVMAKYERTKAETQKVNYAESLVDATEKDLIAKGLIKVNILKSETANERGTSIEILSEAEKVSVNDLMDDRTAQNMIQVSQDRVADPTKQITVLTDVLSDNFQNGETVTLAALKERVEGFDQEATWYQILPGAALDKQLTVECDGYSLEAVKMVILVGGTVVVSKDAE